LIAGGISVTPHATSYVLGRKLFIFSNFPTEDINLSMVIVYFTTIILFTSIIPKSILFWNFIRLPEFQEWGWTAQNSIARQSFARHFWQEINCSTQNLSTAWIQLILSQPDLSRWQKYCQLLESSFKLLSTIFSY
jgi:hypothetical protein